ncbi:MAG TPA: ATP synthase F1 subunit epsilon [Candidatus Hydrogenedentes bacterium]|jgi:F-type H+-transporting ATPase subunit epsilon|nr:ATP synthase F1 subunit epsilon [Candidatus Hydrogenedentota bacterium]
MIQTGSAKRLLQVEICSMDKAPVRLEASLVKLEGCLGPFTVLPGHAPMLASLDIGVMTLHSADGERFFYAVNGGVVKVCNDQVLILPQSFEESGEIDMERAQQAKTKAETILKERHSSELERMEVVLKRAIARIRARSYSEGKV